MSWLKTYEALTKLPDLFLQGRLSFDFDGIPLIAKNIPFKKRMNIIKIGIDKIFRSNFARGLPPIIQVEPTNVCNLKCPLCPTGSNSMKRPKGVMSLVTFQSIIDELGDYLIGVILFCFGEPFLNKDITKMIEACTARNIITLTSTNGNCLQTLDQAVKVVESGLTTMIIAIDGSTQKIYESYRKGGDLDKVKRCVSLMEEAKARCNSRTPCTVVRSVVTANNMDDLPEIESLALNLGVNIFSYKSLGCLVKDNKFKDYEPVKKSMRRFEYSGSSKNRRRPAECIFPFRQPIVFSDGTVAGCEYDHNLDFAFGRIGEKSFKDMWNSPEAVYLRENIRKKNGKAGFCSRCPYERRSQKGVGLFCKELNPITKQ